MMKNKTRYLVVASLFTAALFVSVKPSQAQYAMPLPSYGYGGWTNTLFRPLFPRLWWNRQLRRSTVVYRPVYGTPAATLVARPIYSAAPACCPTPNRDVGRERTY